MLCSPAGLKRQIDWAGLRPMGILPPQPSLLYYRHLPPRLATLATGSSLNRTGTGYGNRIDLRTSHSHKPGASFPALRYNGGDGNRGRRRHLRAGQSLGGLGFSGPRVKEGSA